MRARNRTVPRQPSDHGAFYEGFSHLTDCARATDIRPRCGVVAPGPETTMKFNHIGIPTKDSFAGEIPLPRLKLTVSDHKNNPFGIQWQRYWDDASYPELVKTVAHVAF